LTLTLTLVSTVSNCELQEELKELKPVCVLLQPVTQGEVDKAARISPLALCLVKPPAPELLHSMPVRDQRQLLADWAEATNLASTLIPLSTGTKRTPPKPATRDGGILLTYMCVSCPRSPYGEAL